MQGIVAINEAEWEPGELVRLEGGHSGTGGEGGRALKLDGQEENSLGDETGKDAWGGHDASTWCSGYRRVIFGPLTLSLGRAAGRGGSLGRSRGGPF